VIQTEAYNGLIELIGQTSFWRAFQFTFLQAFLSASLSVVLGLFVSFGLHKLSRNSPWRKLLYKLYLAPFIIPPLFALLGIMNLFSFRWIDGLKGILFLHVYFNAPFVACFLGKTLDQISFDEEKAAITLGASRFKAFRDFTFFKLLPALASNFLLVFVICYTSFLIPFVLAKPGQNTLEVLIYEAVKFELNFIQAIALTLLQLAILAFFAFLTDKISKRWAHRRFGYSLKLNDSSPSLRKLHWPFRSALIFLAFLVFLPLIGQAKSFFELGLFHGLSSISLESGFDGKLPSTLVNSLKTAFLAGLLSTGLAATFHFSIQESNSQKGLSRGFFDSLFLSPLSLSPVILGTSYFIFFVDRTKSFESFNFAHLAILHTALFFPVSYRVLQTYFRNVSPDVLLYAKLYKKPLFLYIKSLYWPHIKLGTFLAFGIIFLLSFGEYTAASLIQHSKLKTFPIYLFELMGRYRIQEANQLIVYLVTLPLGIITIGIGVRSLIRRFRSFAL
jgi:thiamine transport system permease protein